MKDKNYKKKRIDCNIFVWQYEWLSKNKISGNFDNSKFIRDALSEKIEKHEEKQKN